MKSGANRLAEQLCKAGIEATAIHGNKSQPARTRALVAIAALDGKDPRGKPPRVNQAMARSGGGMRHR